MNARRFGPVLLLLAVCGAAAVSQLPATGAVADTGSSPAPQTTPATGAGVQGYPPPIGTGDAATRGRDLYGAGCAGCHGQRGEGTAQGPSLRGVGSASVDFQLSTGRMPLAEVVPQPPRSSPKYGPDDIAALVDYIDRLGAGGPAVPVVSPGDVTRGRTLYVTNCAACHSSTGVGAALPGGRVAPTLLQDDPTQVAEAIRVGPGLMPRFPATALSDEDVDAIASYVQHLPDALDTGGASIGGVGPVTEGLVGWLIGLGLLVAVIRLLGKRAPR